MIYFDHAATTFPKPQRVQRAVQQALLRYGANPGRSGHTLAMQTAVQVYECRERAAALFGAEVDQVVFTTNCTHALNLALKGCLRTGDHVILSDLEHNSVFRPIYAMAEQKRIRYSIAEVQPDAAATVDAFERLITKQTRFIVCTHGSNAFGIRLPIEDIAAMAQRHGILFLVDAAQTAGVLEINVKKTPIDFLCMPGHKGLYGPTGTGLLITPHGKQLLPLMEGGTGSASANPEMPDVMPDCLEAGTLNTVGILGLRAGIDFVQATGVAAIHRKEMKIADNIYETLRTVPGVQLFTKEFCEEKNLPVLSFTISGMASEDVTARLSAMGFALRGGLHCAPLAHKKMGTIDTGTARISVGWWNTMQQANQLCRAIRQIASAKQ